MIDVIYESVGLEYGWRICISDSFPSDVDAAALRTMLQLFITQEYSGKYMSLPQYHHLQMDFLKGLIDIGGAIAILWP